MCNNSTGFDKKLGKKDVPNQVYVYCNFVLGSVSEVERICSMSEHIRTVHRRTTPPHLFKSLIFLRYNERFWNEQLVSEAVKGVRSEHAETLINSHEVYEDDLVQ